MTTATTERDLFRGYARRPDPTGDAALADVVMDRIRELWRFRSWYRARSDWSSFAGLRLANETELRCLVRLARAARRRVETEAAAGSTWRVAAGWQETELRLAAGDR